MIDERSDIFSRINMMPIGEKGIAQRLYVHEQYSFLEKKPTKYVSGLVCVVTNKSTNEEQLLDLAKYETTPDKAFESIMNNLHPDKYTYQWMIKE